MTHDVIIDGKEYVLNTQAEHKEGDPINFPMTKNDMEHHMYNINRAETLLDTYEKEMNCKEILSGLERTQKAFQHMIDETEKRGNWK